MNDQLKIGDRVFSSRLFTGSGKYGNSAVIPEVIRKSGSEVITVAVRRMDFRNPSSNILGHIPENVTLLINTSGAVNTAEAVKIAKIARDGGYGNFVKIEIINETRYLLPDNEEVIKAVKELSKEGFSTLAYMMPDLISAKKMEDAGADAIMPLGSPIGSCQGLKTAEFIKILIENISVPIIVDAGIGKPSEAAQSMEMGAAAVLVNTAIAVSDNPPEMAEAFSLAVKAGRKAYLSGLSPVQQYAAASSPLTGFING